MSFTETKRVFISLAVLLLAIFAMPNSSGATDYSSAGYTVKDPVIDSGLRSSSSANFGLGQSLSQIAIGKSTSASFQLWSGFQYFYRVTQNVLTATPDDGEVDLSWTVPSTYLGVSVSGYQVGTGTTSGSYVFQNVGNVTSFTKSGLTNGTPYFFIVKAYAPGGTFLVYSNEATATPNGAVTPPPPPPPGGGGGPSANNIMISGTAYPGASVTLLVNSAVSGNVTADSAGNFSFTNYYSAGNYNFTLYAVDVNGTKSANVTVSRTLADYVLTSVSGVILPPTLTEDFSAVKQGQPITFRGYAAPNSAVVLTFAGAQSLTASTSSDSTGKFAYTLSTGALKKGDYTVFANSTVSAVKSPNSLTLQFNVGDTTVTPPSGECSKRSDLNCDGKVDLVDFSILLYFWEAADFSKNPRVDIDKSGDVGLRDLSIMLYDWTG